MGDAIASSAPISIHQHPTTMVTVSRACHTGRAGNYARNGSKLMPKLSRSQPQHSHSTATAQSQHSHSTVPAQPRHRTCISTAATICHNVFHNSATTIPRAEARQMQSSHTIDPPPRPQHSPPRPTHRGLCNVAGGVDPVERDEVPPPDSPPPPVNRSHGIGWHQPASDQHGHSVNINVDSKHCR